ncbi:universal stress protein [Streptomyces atriruber]|uniref:universal stress protein n=1 Tax=Streptomyces atriruber TaxID=545121 RepID=UPI0006E21947|nr:universal stress protein [Streptomyces atriruber]
MPVTVTVGLDGSPESLAAAEWAAREAKLRGMPVKLVHVLDPIPVPTAQAPLIGAETLQYWRERVPRKSAGDLRLRHPDVEIVDEQAVGRPADALTAAAEDAALLVLGSRGLSGVGGYLVGSVGQAVVARTATPVVLVRAEEESAEGHTTDLPDVAPTANAHRPIVLGLDIDQPDDSVIEFAFDEATRHLAPLRVVHAWDCPPYYPYGFSAEPGLYERLSHQQAAALSEVVRPWREKFPGVDIVEVSPFGAAAKHLVEASREGSLLVVGRRSRRRALGLHIGPVTHAVLHHASIPVAVVAHP